ncbi:MAG: CcmD family protein [Bacteroidetes bacterium]|nr:CcmD family protein [Bacteroidia bacterium]PCH66823.1 MAG: CcmD family protein [Bacteroidota bacterium]
MKKSGVLVCSILFFAMNVFAEESENLFRSSGKIYVVVSVLVTIFLGIVIYLMVLDKRIGKLEKKEEEQENN